MLAKKRTVFSRDAQSSKQTPILPLLCFAEHKKYKVEQCYEFIAEIWIYKPAHKAAVFRLVPILLTN